MAGPRLYHPSPLQPQDTIALTSAAFGHAIRSLRLRKGDRIILFNGDGHDYSAILDQIHRSSASATVGECRANHTESHLSIHLLLGISRADHMELALQKATELGVKRISPILCARSQGNLTRYLQKRTRWESILISACEQSGRARLPELSSPMSLNHALEACPESTRLALVPASTQGLGSLGKPEDARVALAVGPEGGLLDGELEQLDRGGFRSLHLGPRILRTETAPLAAITALQLLFGDMG